MHQPGLSADLDSFDLLDLAQVIQMARRDLSLVVRAGSQSLGVLRFSQGELLWAEFGTLRGEEAFMALAALHAGSIEERAWDGRGDRNVNQPLARLVMQAVEYRDAQDYHQPQPAPEHVSRSRPVQSANQPEPTIKAPERLNGFDSRPRLGNRTPASQEPLPEDEAMPSWVREIHSASEAFSAQSTSAISPVPAAAPPAPFPQPPSSFYSAQTEPLTPPPQAALRSSSSLLQEEMDMQIPEPRVPLSSLNGKFTLPSLANGSRTPSHPSSTLSEDPPTVPLPSMPGGLRDFGAKRAPHSPELPQESAPPLALETDPLPGLAVAARPSAAVVASPTPPPPPAETPAPPALFVPAAPADEPKMSSLSMLEQLAYGGSRNNGSAEAAAPLAPLIEQPPAPPRPPGQDAAAIGQNGRAAARAVPAPASPATESALPALSSLAAPTLAPPSAEGMQRLQQALEAFAEQVGAACIATAVIRADGLLLAEYKVRRGQDQDLGSPAYHMAHVMQSSLRALLMGGWGDLEDTIITGNTHSVVLRRLGRSEKGAFHVAVLERSGNPGLCRVRMRNSEAALLQNL